VCGLGSRAVLGWLLRATPHCLGMGNAAAVVHGEEATARRSVSACSIVEIERLMLQPFGERDLIAFTNIVQSAEVRPWLHARQCRKTRAWSQMERWVGQRELRRNKQRPWGSGQVHAPRSGRNVRRIRVCDHNVDAIFSVTRQRAAVRKGSHGRSDRVRHRVMSHPRLRRLTSGGLRERATESSADAVVVRDRAFTGVGCTNRDVFPLPARGRRTILVAS